MTNPIIANSIIDQLPYIKILKKEEKPNQIPKNAAYLLQTRTLLMGYAINPRLLHLTFYLIWKTTPLPRPQLILLKQINIYYHGWVLLLLILILEIIEIIYKRLDKAPRFLILLTKSDRVIITACNSSLSPTTCLKMKKDETIPTVYYLFKHLTLPAAIRRL